MIKRIIITGDMTRPCPEQNGNVLAHYWMLKPIFPNLEYYLTDRWGSIESWMSYYQATDIDKSWIESKTNVNEETLLILLESPVSEIERFKKLGIPFIYLAGGPLGCLALPECAPTLQDVLMYSLSTHKINVTGEFYSKEQQYKDTCYKRAEYIYKHRIPCPDNTAVIFGQYVIEMSHITKDNRFCTLKDFEKEIKEVINTHNQTIYKFHPGDPDEHEYKEYMKSLGCVLDDYVIPYTAYDYMSEPKIKDIYSIYGSVIEESEFFDVKATRWYNYIHDRYPVCQYITKKNLLNTLKVEGVHYAK